MLRYAPEARPIDDLRFPHFTVLKASAGSGKTYALSKRFAGFLLSGSIQGNLPGNLLAVTFSNNAAREMKERVLDMLKRICLGDEELIADFDLDNDTRSRLSARAGQVVDTILANYGDFQVKTIDSFMTSIFKASAIDFGYSPDFDIAMNNAELMGYAFDLFLRRVREGTKESAFMKDVIETMLANQGGDAPYPWEPANEILDEITGIYRKVAAYEKPLNIFDHRADLRKMKEVIAAEIGLLDEVIRESELVRSRASSYEMLRVAAEEGRFPDLIGKGMKNPPVCKPKSEGNHEAYHEVLTKWRALAGTIADYTKLYARSYYTPYLRVYEGFSDVLERTKRKEGKIFIEDVNKKLAEYLSDQCVPDVYLRLGEAIYHYFIDEFQDTSPIQWHNLFPLLDNSLSQGGSLFVVGDTKQAIYGFRDADYKIMKRLETENTFPSAAHRVEELHTNYRSDGTLVAFIEHLFQRTLPEWEEYREAAAETGLLDYCQDAKKEKQGRGYVHACLVERNDSEPPEREKLYDLIEGLVARGYRHSDITILSQKNNDVVRVMTWLNARQIPSLSYSSLDIRTRKVTGEIVALLNFLDSPLDDLSFATFILGDVFQRVLDDRGRTAARARLHDLCFRQRKHETGSLYKAFQAEMAELWDGYFDRLFRSSGYLPIYDLISEIYSVFELFRLFGEEEAVLAKILEVVKDLEMEGASSLRGFLRLASSAASDQGDWDVDVPHGIDAVKVMTVHKSKGLGFPVVILLLYGERSKGHRYAVWEEAGAVSLVRLTKAIADADESFARRYADEEKKERVSKLNSLYVALTRAGSELYVIGVKRERERFPFALFPDGMVCCRGEAAEAAKGPDETTLPVDAFHLSTPFEGGSASDDAIRFEEKKRGELVHKLFSSVEYLDEDTEGMLAEAAGTIALGMGAGDDEMSRLASLTLEFLKSSALSGYYERKPGRKVFTEKEIVDSEGRLFRVDRVVVDPDKVCIIEYKTGSDQEREREHLAQMRNYLRIAGDLYRDRSVEGVIGYVDLGRTRRLIDEG